MAIAHLSAIAGGEGVPLKPLDSIVESYPWPPLDHEANYRQLLRFALADFALINQPAFIAYLLATVRHETAFTFAPIEEYGHGARHPYGEEDPITGKAYYGRGYVQITWKENYKRFCPVVGLDLVDHPELALEPAVAYRIASVGMRQGMFTGKKLVDFVMPNGSYDWVGARKIINGTDQAERIAGYAKKFYASLLPI